MTVAASLYLGILKGCRGLLLSTADQSLLRQQCLNRVTGMLAVHERQPRIIFDYLEAGRTALVMGVNEGYLSEAWVRVNARAI